MPERIEGLVWGLCALGGCEEDYSPETGTIITAPKTCVKNLELIKEGDMVSWKGLWHRVRAVKYDAETEIVTLGLI